MPNKRRPSKHLRPPRPLNAQQHATRRQTAAGAFLVREVPANKALKPYTCPGCSNSITVGMAHVVAWPETPDLGFESGLDQRRHWHKHCWRLPR